MVTFSKLLPLCLLIISRAVIAAARLGDGIHAHDDETQPNLTVTNITSQPTSSFPSYAQGNLVRGIADKFNRGFLPAAFPSRSQWNCTTSPSYSKGDDDGGGLGVFITNADVFNRQAFFVYHNLCDYVPFKYLWVDAGATAFLSIPVGFQGRIVRGNEQWNLGGIPRPLGTWFEFSLDNNSWIWGDVSLIRGCDGSVLMWALDSSGAWKGFTQWILDGAPFKAYDKKPSGQWVLKATEGWNGSTDPIPRDWELKMVGAEYVYVDDGHGSPVIASTNGRFATYWSPGRI
ncbi:unnamed protein product [Discula destructiva]